jgi:phage terminase large subunit
LCTGRRFGKTTLAVEEIKGLAIYTSDAKICYVAPTYQQARDIAWEMLKKELQPITITANESRLELIVRNTKGNTSQIILRGWEAIETLRGQKFHFIVIDEVAMMRNFWMNWQEIIRPTLTDYKGQVMFISTPKGFNHFYELYNQEAEDQDYKSFHFTSYDNPHLPKEEIDKAKEELIEDRFAQEYLADFRKTAGLVYKEFRRESHLIDGTNYPIFTDILLGVDFGYTNPACVLKIGKTADNLYVVMDEWYKTKQTTAQIIEVCQSFKSNMVYPDPAEPDRIAEMTSAGLNCREVSKDIPAGINQVRELFKQQRLLINRNCSNLIWELETYSYPDKTPDKNEEERPIKENDHAMDALRYVLYTNLPQTNKAESYTPVWDLN